MYRTIYIYIYIFWHCAWHCEEKNVFVANEVQNRDVAGKETQLICGHNNSPRTQSQAAASDLFRRGSRITRRPANSLSTVSANMIKSLCIAAFCKSVCLSGDGQDGDRVIMGTQMLTELCITCFVEEFYK